jgi:hypothetical protein
MVFASVSASFLNQFQEWVKTVVTPMKFSKGWQPMYAIYAIIYPGPKNTSIEKRFTNFLGVFIYLLGWR